MEVKETQVAVIGGGPGGYAAAFMAADLGLDVTLVDYEPNPGGTCLYRGCIPSKALLHAAKLISDAREAKHWGLDFGEARIDTDRLREATFGVVRQLTDGLGELCKARKIRHVQGLASFVDSHTVEVFREQQHERVRADKTIIAVGSRPQRLGPLIDSPRIMNSTSALQLPDVPKSLLVIGGGYIGLELGSVYATLGAKVTLVEMTNSLLPGADKELVKPLHARMDKLFENIYLETKVEDMKEQKNGIKVRLEGEGVGRKDRTFDKVLVCVGRRPNASGLNLQSTGVEVDTNGFIQVDEQRRTTDPDIFAIGDVVGGMMLAHKASHEGRVAAEVIAGRNVAFEPQAIPAVVFTDPEVAWCGLQPDEAKAQGRPVKVLRFPWAASGRASTLNLRDGLTKLICDVDTEQILGMGIVGQGAGELISEGVLAVEMGAVASDLDLAIHPHPTRSETIMESAATFHGMSTHIYRPSGKKRAAK